MNSLHCRPGIEQDILNTTRFLIDQSEDAARRFVESVQESLKEIAQHPGFGSRKEYTNPELADVRSWWIKGFKNYLIYYLPKPDGIDVLAIMHGSRDVERRLEQRLAE